MMFGTLDIRSTDIIDWYDGVISAVVELGDERAPHLCLGVAWSPDYDERVYALVPASAEVASELRAALGGNPAIGADWPTVARLVRQAQAAHHGNITVIAADRTEHEVLSSIELPSSEVPELQMHHERTSAILGEGRLRRWLLRLEVSVPPDPF